MTPAQYESRLHDLAQQLHRRNLDRVYVPAANRLLATIKRRIQRDGKGSHDTPLGQYSTKPGYYAKAAFVKKSAFKPIGKNGKRRKGEKAKTMYLPGGYKNLRLLQGRITGKVNLTYSGDLMASYKMVQQQDRIVLGLDSEKEAEKAAGLRKRYGKFLQGSRKELLAYHKEAKDGLQKLTLETLTQIRNS